MSLNRLGIIKEIAERKKRIAKLREQSKAITAQLNRNPVKSEFVQVPNEKTHITHWTDAYK